MVEIIETYWNVNEFVFKLEHKNYYEIIETYWNVNVISETCRIDMF